VVGAAFGAADGKADFGDNRVGDNVKVTSTQLSAYATRNFGDWYGYGILAYGQHNFSSNRDTQGSGVAHADFRGEQWGARIGAAKPIKISPTLTISPTAGLEYSNLKLNGYSESGALAGNLDVQGQTIERLRSRLGARLTTELPGTGGYVVRPVIHAFWLHDFQTASPDVAASAVGDSTVFLTPSQSAPRDMARVGAALVVAKAKTFTGEIRYDLDLGPSYSGQALSAMARWAF